MKDLYHKLMVWFWNTIHPFSLYRKWYGEIKPTKRFGISEGVANEAYMLGIDVNEKWEILQCKSGAEYKWKYDDKCIAVKVGENIIHLERQAIQFFKERIQKEYRRRKKEFS